MVDEDGTLEEYPGKTLRHMIEKDWVRLFDMECSPGEFVRLVQVYIFPEDVGRQYRRGQISDFRRALRHLMPFVDRSQDAWAGKPSSLSPMKSYLSSDDVDESLFYIFNTLQSPNPLPESVSDQNSRVAMLDALGGQIVGLQRELYSYQRRSVAMMIQKEAAPARISDPRMRKLQSPSGQQFYYDREEGRLMLQPDHYEDQRGGILAETMGYGKTLICLALILATRGHFPHVPEGRLAVEQPLRPRTASLLEMAGASAGRSGRPWKAHFHELKMLGYHHEKCTSLLHENVGCYSEPLFVPRSGNRKKERPTEKIIKLCSATLVIVPPNLLGQWRGEISKHTEDGALDVLAIDHSTKVIPHEDILRRYDIVLITKPRFEQEYRDNDLHTGKRGRNEELFQSPLSELRWLRVIVDEGHNFASSGHRTNAMAMLDKMHIERRWVVSGTPSNALVGVEVGMAADEMNIATESPSRKAKRVLQGRQTVDSYVEERKNLEKLRLIVMNFVKLQPWANSRGDDHAAWNRYMGVSRSANGPLQKAADLRLILQNLIIRHRIEDIEADLSLPPLYNKVVYLKPSFYDKLSINLFLAILASNAVTSERTDQDYMFHEKNRKQLEVLISNLRQSSFHWVGLKEHDLTEAIRISKLYLDKDPDLVVASDKKLLLDAIEVSEKALNNPAWKAFSTLHEIGVFVENFPDFSAETWTLDGRVSQPLLLGTVQARLAQQFVDDRLGDPDPTEGLSGAGVKAMSNARKRAAEEDATAAKNKKDSTVTEEPKLKDQPTTSRIRSASIGSNGKSKQVRELDPNSPLAATAVVGFSSSKLTYLISQLLLLSPTEKSIIFYSHNNVAFWLAEALELMGIRFLIYSNTLTVSRRATYLATFNQKEEFRVLLMDLKQAAHGLHVAAASRVFIVEPIWQPGIESQAIKRAHRIGQTKAVYVETLVLEDTLEDRMLRRRKQMSNSELQKAEKSLLDDTTMNEILKNEKLIPFTDEEANATGEMAPLPVPERFFGRFRDPMIDLDNPDEGLVLDPADKRRAKKRKATVKQVDLTLDSSRSNGSPKKAKKVTVVFASDTGPLSEATSSSPVPATESILASNVSFNTATPGEGTPATLPRNQETRTVSIFGGPIRTE